MWFKWFEELVLEENRVDLIHPELQKFLLSFHLPFNTTVGDRIDYFFKPILKNLKNETKN